MSSQPDSDLTAIMEESRKEMYNGTINDRVMRLEESATLRIADLARKIEREGHRVVKLQTGDPDFDTPEVVVSAAYQSMKQGRTHYADTRGLPNLRDALAAKLLKDNQITYDPESELLVTHGASHAIFIALQTLIKPGDEVLIPGPYWMTYGSSVSLSGGIPVEVPTISDSNFSLDINEFYKRITDKTRMIILNSPNNPTGYVTPLGFMKELSALVLKHSLYVISDEVYEKLTYDGAEHVSFATLPGMKSRTITVNSFSKTYAMTGWRLGYIAAEGELVDQILKVAQCAGTNVPPFSQEGAIVALSDLGVAQYVQNMREKYNKRREFVIERVDKMEGLSLAIPRGAFYFMLNISRFNSDSTQFAYQILHDQKVAVVPGASFGKCGEGWVRITFAADEAQLDEGLERIGKFLNVG